MKCKEARRIMVRKLAEGGDGGEYLELADHLAACEDCRRTEVHYRGVGEEIGALEATELPEEATEAIIAGSRATLEGGDPLQRPPADPTPERSTRQKVAVFAVAMLGLAAAAVAALLVSRGEHEPLPRAGEVAFKSGKVQLQPPGAGHWEELGDYDALVPGCSLRTGPSGVARIAGLNAEYRLDRLSALAFGPPGTAELMTGRAYVRWDGAEGELLTTSGRLSGSDGAFVVRKTPRRLFVVSVSGQGAVGPAGEATELRAGQAVMLGAKGRTGPVRKTSTPGWEHWMIGLDSAFEGRLRPRHLAAVAVEAEQPVLPSSVRIERLRVRIALRGPLALIRVDVRLGNRGGEPWRGRLDLSELVLPAPVASGGPAEVGLQPGERGDYQLAVLCQIGRRGGFQTVGLNPARWTGRSIQRLRFRVEGAADGGFDQVRFPAHTGAARDGESVEWSWSATDADPARPLVVDYALEEDSGVDVMVLGGGRERGAFCAWRPDAGRDEWIPETARILLAVDATGDFGPGGRGFVQGVMEGLAGGIPRGFRTALIGYTGRTWVDQAPWGRHSPMRAEAMLSAGWELEPEEERGSATEFLSSVLRLAAGGKRRALLLFVTGRESPSEMELPEVGPNVRVLVVQAGADRAAELYRRLGAGSGGAAAALPARCDPVLAGLGVLADMRRPAVAAAELALEDGRRGRMLIGPGNFLSRPVLAAVEVGQGGGAVAGRFRAETGQGVLERDFHRPIPRSADAAGPAVDALLARLRSGR